MISAEWNNTEQLYHIVLEDIISGTTSTTSAHILVTALGILNLPKYPDIAGLSNLNGKLFHSARWNSDIKLSGQRVAVIGNGSSACVSSSPLVRTDSSSLKLALFSAQFIPVITKDPNVNVTQFIRTPNWYTESVRSVSLQRCTTDRLIPAQPRKSFSSATKWFFAKVPFAMRIYRNFLYLKVGPCGPLRSASRELTHQ